MLTNFILEPVRIAWDLVCTRISALTPEENGRDSEARIVWWKNYLVFACASISWVTDCKFLKIDFICKYLPELPSGSYRLS